MVLRIKVNKVSQWKLERIVYLRTVKLQPGASHESKSILSISNPQSSSAHKAMVGSSNIALRFTGRDSDEPESDDRLIDSI